MGRPKKESRYVSLVAVAINGPGVIDMLRYDTCVPATEEDAHKIARVVAYEGEPGDRLVVLRRFAANADGPTEGRWRSFGCRVLAVRHPDDSPWTAAELTNLAKIAGITGAVTP